MSRKIVLTICAIFLAWRLSLFGIAVVKDFFLPYQPQFTPRTIIEIDQLPRFIANWANFDGVHYLTIAEKGYVGTGLIQAFFPLFPYVILHSMVVVLHFSPPAVVVIGLVANSMFGALAVILLYLLAKKLFPNQNPAWIVAVFLLFPTSFFIGALYTEALFLLLVIASFYAAEEKRWPVVGLLVGLASATRLVGVFLIPAFFVQIFWEWYSTKKKKLQLKDLLPTDLRFLWILLGTIGLLTYMIYLQLQFQDALYFFHVQSAFGAGRQTSLVLYPQVLWRGIKIVITTFGTNWRYWTSVWELIAGVGGLALILLGIKKYKISYTVFALGAFLLPTLTGNFSSMPRYILVCLPIFFMLGDWSARSRLFRWIWLPLTTIAFVINTVLFLQGYWVG